MNFCLNCEKPTKNKKFCSRSCSSSKNNIGVKRYSSELPICISCGKKLSRQGKYCSNKCQWKYTTGEIYKKIEQNELVNWKQIRKYLLKKNAKCQICGIEKWLGRSISLECDHIDGDISNSRLSNSRLLCPNCHSQTETFRYKNTKNPLGKKLRKERYDKNLKVMATLPGLEPGIEA